MIREGGLNFKTSPSGLLVPTTADNSALGAVDVHYELDTPGDSGKVLRGDATWAGAVDVVTADVSTPDAGQIELDTSGGRLSVWDGSAWWRVPVTQDSPPGPPTFVDATLTRVPSNTSQNVNLPAGIAAGEVLVLIGHISATTNPSPETIPSGWTAVGGGSHYVIQNSSGIDWAYCYYRVADGTEGSTTHFGYGGANVSGNWSVLRYSGSLGIDAAAAAGAPSTSSSPALPALTTGHASEIVVGLVSAQSATSATPGSGWTERVDQNYSAWDGSFIYAQEIEQGTAGASSTSGPAISGFSGKAYAFKVAIRGGA